jgi:hypothetical protein
MRIFDVIRRAVDHVGGVMAPGGVIDGAMAAEAVKYVQARFGKGKGPEVLSVEDVDAVMRVVWVLEALVSER